MIVGVSPTDLLRARADQRWRGKGIESEARQTDRNETKRLDTMADAAVEPEVVGGALQTAKDLFSGAAGGVAQVLLGTLFNCAEQ